MFIKSKHYEYGKDDDNNTSLTKLISQIITKPIIPIVAKDYVIFVN